jgi:NAD+ synthase
MGCNDLEKRIRMAKMKSKLVADQIGDFIIKEVLQCNYAGVVIGLSGGVDSSTTAALAKRAFDKYNKSHPKNRLEVKAYMLPAETNNSEDTLDAVKVANHLKIKYEILDIQPVVDAYKETNPEAFESRYDKGNLMSRVRSNILSTKAATEKKLVMGTGNRDEDFGVGYYTLFGDGAVHMSPIGGLSKRLVKQMALYCKLRPDHIVYKNPSAGLEHGQTDFKDLGYSYDTTVERVVNGIEQGFSMEEICQNKKVISDARKDIRDYEELYTKPKFRSVEEIVHDIKRRNLVARKKSEIIHPPIPKISLRYE